MFNDCNDDFSKEIEGLKELHRAIEGLAQAKSTLHRSRREWGYTKFAESEVKRLVKHCNELARKFIRA